MADPALPAQPLHDGGALFVHVRVLLGIITGLGLTHLLRNFADLMDRPAKRTYWIHLAWALYVFLYVLHFWWWEFRLSLLNPWSVNVYMFITLYALLLYLLCAFTFSARIDEYPGYREYFYTRRHWFFGLLAAIFLVDMWDTWIKGARHFQDLGIEYPVRNITHVALCLVAMKTRNPAFHSVFVLAALAYEITWILRAFEFVG